MKQSIIVIIMLLLCVQVRGDDHGSILSSCNLAQSSDSEGEIYECPSIPYIPKGFSFKLRTGMSIYHYKDITFFETKPGVKIFETEEFDERLPFIGIGFSYIRNKFVISANYQRLDRSSAIDREKFREYDNVDVWRDEVDFSMGYSFFSKGIHELSLSGGYRKSRSNVDYAKVRNPSTGRELDYIEADFVTKGPFAILSYKLGPFTDSESAVLKPLGNMKLNFNLGYARLRSEITQNTAQHGPSDPSNPGPADALRYGVYLSTPMVVFSQKALFFTIGAEHYLYAVNPEKETESGFGSSIKELKERVTNLSLSFNYSFDF